MRLLKESVTTALILLFCISNIYSQNPIYKTGEDLILRGRYQEALQDALTKINDPSIKGYDLGKIYLNLGRTHQYLFRYDKAFTSLQKANSLFKEAGSLRGRIESHIWLLEYYRSTSNIYQVRKLDVLCASDLDSLKDNNDLLALFYNRKGAYINQFYLDSIEQAANYIHKSIELATNTDSPYYTYIVGNACLDIGLYYERKKDPLCFDYYRKSQRLWEEVGNMHYSTQSFLSLTQAHYVFGNYEEALKIASKAFEIATKYELSDVRSRCLYQNYMIYDAMGDYKKALDFLRSYHETNFFSLPLEVYHTMLEAEKNFDEATKIKDNELSVANLELADQFTKRANAERNILAVIVGLVIIILVVVYFVYRKMQRDKKELEHALSFNQMLLKEVNHRVKNNLAFLKSMFYLKEKYVDEPETKEILVEFQNRLQAMASVHEQLYRVDNENGMVNLRTVLLSNMREFESVVQQKGRQVIFQVKGETEFVKMEHGVPIMLIINELCTNSVKYVQTGEVHITVEFSVKEGQLVIEYSDSGPGLSIDQYENSNGFGLRMVRLMLKQIGGTAILKGDRIIFHVQL